MPRMRGAEEAMAATRLCFVRVQSLELEGWGLGFGVQGLGFSRLEDQQILGSADLGFRIPEGLGTWVRQRRPATRGAPLAVARPSPGRAARPLA